MANYPPPSGFAIASASSSNRCSWESSPAPQASRWAKTLTPKLYDQLVSYRLLPERRTGVAVTLKAHLDGYALARKKEVKPSTRINWSHTSRTCCTYSDRIGCLSRSSTEGDAKDFDGFLKTEAHNTVCRQRRRTGLAGRHARGKTHRKCQAVFLRRRSGPRADRNEPIRRVKRSMVEQDHVIPNPAAPDAGEGP